MSLTRFKQLVQSRIGERGGLVHSVGTLVGGTAFAQALTILALPLLTRLYTPDEFSVLAVYTSVLGILSVVACLRLEIAIPLPEHDEDAVNLLALALGFGLMLSGMVAVVVLLFGTQLAAWLRFPAFAPYLWMVPLGMAVASAYAGTQYWSTRKKKFTPIARTRMLQALGGLGLQTGAGAAGVGPFGLLLGHMVSSGAGFIGLARDALRHDRKLLSAISLPNMRRMLGEYSRFPKYSTWEAFANTAGVQVPVIMIAALALGPEAGFVMLATRIIAAPMSLIGGSLAQVYLAHASDELRAGRLGDFTAKILGGLLKTGVGPLLFIGIVAGPASSIIFGQEWSRVGELIAWMTPWFILQFLSSPVSMVMHVKQHQRLMMSMQTIGLILRVTAVWAAYAIHADITSEVYAVSGAVFYLLATIVYYTVADIRWKSLRQLIPSASGHLILWLLAAYCTRWLITAAYALA